MSTAGDHQWHDEYERFHCARRTWDVRLAKTYIRQHPDWAVEDFEVDDLAGMSRLMGATNTSLEQKGDLIDLDDPIIVATVTMGGQVVAMPIDGWHRIAKAHAEGVKALPAVILNEEFSLACEIE